MNDVFGVPAKLSREVFALQTQLRGAFRDSLRVGATLGILLEKAKAECQHGDFLKWLKANFEGSARQAQRFMLLAREYPDPDKIPALSLREALRLIAGKQATAKTFFAHERLSRETVSALRRGLANLLRLAKSQMISPLEIEGLTPKHPAMKAAKKLEADLRRLREMVQTLEGGIEETTETTARSTG